MWWQKLLKEQDREGKERTSSLLYPTTFEESPVSSLLKILLANRNRKR
jgi:hypothetical protein